MKEENITDRFEDTARDLLDYGQLRLDAVKLKVLEKGATLFGKILTTIVLLLVGSFALVYVSFALTMLLAQWLGSMGFAVLIIAGVFILATVILYLLRKKLFVNTMVKMLSELLFDNHKNN